MQNLPRGASSPTCTVPVNRLRHFVQPCGRIPMVGAHDTRHASGDECYRSPVCIMDSLGNHRPRGTQRGYLTRRHDSMV